MFLPQFKTALQSLKSKPAQHISSFLILHELTSIIPLPIVYYTLKSFDYVPTWNTKFGVEMTTKAQEKIKKSCDYFGIEEFKGKELVWMVASYVIVKLMMPARIGLSLYLTPIGARILDKIPRIFKR